MQMDAWDLYLKRDEAVTGLLQQLLCVLNGPTDGTPEQAIDRQAKAKKLTTAIHFKHQILGEAVGSFARLMDDEIRHYRKQTGIFT
ncbi:MAG: hypothetical protein Q7T21_10905 [Gallionella sp.]|nr:hypothetical protein [Gallionella sp.]